MSNYTGGVMTAVRQFGKNGISIINNTLKKLPFIHNPGEFDELTEKLLALKGVLHLLSERNEELDRENFALKKRNETLENHRE